jgi:hypothetical protein
VLTLERFFSRRLYAKVLPVKNFQNIIIGVLSVLLLIVAVQSFLPKSIESDPQSEPDVPLVKESCIGQPIKVDYAYTGGVLDPWACQIQCSDNQPRYVLYTDGQATQCETPPGCFDTGEDNGITCNPPGASTAS